MQDWIVPVLATGLAAVALGLGVVLVRARSRTAQELDRARAETAALQAQLEELERRVDRADPRPAADAEFLITDLGQAATEPAPEPGAATHVGGALFADLVLRETVVKAASLAHGVRRALDAETRNRIRFEMRREVRASRRRRLRLQKELLRKARAADRAALDEEDTAA